MPVLGNIAESSDSRNRKVHAWEMKRTTCEISLHGQVLGRSVPPNMNSRTIFHNLQIIGRVLNKKEQPAHGRGQFPGRR